MRLKLTLFAGPSRDMASGQASSCTAARQSGSGRRHEHQLHHDFSVLDGLTGKSARGGESAAGRSSYQRVPPVEQLLNSDGIFWSRVDGDIDETGVFCFSFASNIEKYGHACTNTYSTRVLLTSLSPELVSRLPSYSEAGRQL